MQPCILQHRRPKTINQLEILFKWAWMPNSNLSMGELPNSMRSYSIALFFEVAN
jgi:hypothetical protein